jgi:membrane-associated protein
VNLETLLTKGLEFVGAFTPQVAIFVFLINIIGEGFVVSIPLLFETTLLAAGLQFSAGVMPLKDLLLLMLTAQLGRQVGALILYFLSRKGTSFFSRFIARRLPKRIPEKQAVDVLDRFDRLTGKEPRGSPSREATHGGLLGKIDSISPFGVALGRILWLRIPLTLLLGARGKLKTLVLGIAISSTVYEGIYIGLGAVVGTTNIPYSGYLLLYFAGGLSVLYVAALGIRFAVRSIRRRIIKK